VTITPFPVIGSIRSLTVPLPGFHALICSNTFVLGTGPITLIDCAPKFPGSLLTLERQLHEIGFDWKDVERIIITHGHIDHFGLVCQIRSASGHDIPCYVHQDDLWKLSGEYINSGMWSEDADAFYAKMGMPEKTVELMRRRSQFFKNLCDPVDDAIPIEEGAVFQGSGFDLEVIHTPGHSPGCCCLYERQNKILFSGDHILKHITPNPFHEVIRSRLKDPSYKSLKAYMESLEKLEHLPIRYVFPAHGEYISDLESLITGYRKHHEERTEVIWLALKSGERCIYELMKDVFPGIDEFEAFLAVSEVLVHLELLIEAGRAELAEEGPPLIFHAS
jgi:glyoxylase-like metal-dependent hydrolase (beta-lactamase superfamily II)